MSKIKEALENNEILVTCLKSALKNKRITIEQVKEFEKNLKRDFPATHYDFSELYNEDKD